MEGPDYSDELESLKSVGYDAAEALQKRHVPIAEGLRIDWTSGCRYQTNRDGSKGDTSNSGALP